jgi:hypothetical protein
MRGEAEPFAATPAICEQREPFERCNRAICAAQRRAYAFPATLPQIFANDTAAPTATTVSTAAIVARP